MEIILICLGALLGILYTDAIGYYLSRLMSWRKTPISGHWISEYKKDDQTVNERIEIFGSLGDVSWGILKVQSEEPNQVNPYRVKLVEEFKGVYSVVLKPQDRSMADIGAGTLVLNEIGESASGSVVGFDFVRREPVERVVSIRRVCAA